MNNIFNLSNDEITLINTKKGNKNKLGFAILLKYFQWENHYPKHIKFVDPRMLHSVANQLNVRATLVNHFDWEGRSTERYRLEIREFLGYRAVTDSDVKHFKSWLEENVFPQVVKKTQYIEHAYAYFRDNRIEPFTSKELERHIRSAHHAFERQLFESIANTLPDKTKKIMDRILADESDNDDDESNGEHYQFLAPFFTMNLLIPGKNFIKSSII
jgi:hypothetical protein